MDKGLEGAAGTVLEVSSGAEEEAVEIENVSGKEKTEDSEEVSTEDTEGIEEDTDEEAGTEEEGGAEGGTEEETEKGSEEVATIEDTEDTEDTDDKAEASEWTEETVDEPCNEDATEELAVEDEGKKEEEDNKEDADREEDNTGIEELSAVANDGDDDGNDELEDKLLVVGDGGDTDFVHPPGHASTVTVVDERGSVERQEKQAGERMTLVLVLAK